MAENTIPSIVPPVVPPEGDKPLFSSVIPEEFKDEGYFKDLAPMELDAGRAEFFKKFSDGEMDDAFSNVSDAAVWWVPGDLPFSGTKSKEEYLQVVGAIIRIECLQTRK